MSQEKIIITEINTSKIKATQTHNKIKKHTYAEDLFHKVLRLGRSVYRGLLSFRKIRLLFGHHVQAKTVVMKMLKLGLIIPATEQDRYICDKNDMKNNKYTNRRLYAVTNKGFTLLSILDEMNALCPLDQMGKYKKYKKK